MKDKEIKILEENGWIIECEHPLEIYHEESNSKATNMAAKVIIKDILENDISNLTENEISNLTENEIKFELININTYIQMILPKEIVSDEEWKNIYDTIFSSKISQKVFKYTEKLNNKLDWYDPDSSYEEDVLAFTNAVNYYIKDMLKENKFKI